MLLFSIILQTPLAACKKRASKHRSTSTLNRRSTGRPSGAGIGPPPAWERARARRSSRENSAATTGGAVGSRPLLYCLGCFCCCCCERGPRREITISDRKARPPANPAFCLCLELAVGRLAAQRRSLGRSASQPASRPAGRPVAAKSLAKKSPPPSPPATASEPAAGQGAAAANA